MKIKLDPGAIMPTRAHDTDAGLDLYAPRPLNPNAPGSWVISPEGTVIDTGVHIELPHGYYGKIESKSGLNVKYGIVSLGGVIDEGYTGAIKVKLYAMSNRGCYLHIDSGDKIAQLIIMPYIAPELELVDELEPTERGDNGFGSTGR